MVKCKDWKLNFWRTNSCYGIGMESFRDDQSACPQSEQHLDHVSDSDEDAISDEDVLAPTRLSLACAAPKEREKENRMVEQEEPTIWDEVLEEADELAYVHRVPHSISFLSAGTGKRKKSENKLKFSIRGSSSVSLNVKTENPYVGEQEVSSGMPISRDPENMMAEQLDNIDEETEDLPSEFGCPTKKANISIAELLDGLHGRSAISVGTPFLLHQQTRTKEEKPKFPTSVKKTLALLGQRNLETESPLEHVIGETSSEEEDNAQNNMTLINKDVKGQTMADIFQHLPTTGEVSTGGDMDNMSMERTIIFSPKICDNVDLVAGNIIHIFPPWFASYKPFLHLFSQFRVEKITTALPQQERS
uniref:Uncharacterized protein n=1 Tax=Leersia perrieri TaxID=77586 RepID=A0A0D9VK41_9ORYZ